MSARRQLGCGIYELDGGITILQDFRAHETRDRGREREPRLSALLQGDAAVAGPPPPPSASYASSEDETATAPWRQDALEHSAELGGYAHRRPEYDTLAGTAHKNSATSVASRSPENECQASVWLDP